MTSLRVKQNHPTQCQAEQSWLAIDQRLTSHMMRGNLDIGVCCLWSFRWCRLSRRNDHSWSTPADGVHRHHISWSRLCNLSDQPSHLPLWWKWVELSSCSVKVKPRTPVALWRWSLARWKLWSIPPQWSIDQWLWSVPTRNNQNIDGCKVGRRLLEATQCFHLMDPLSNCTSWPWTTALVQLVYIYI